MKGMKRWIALILAIVMVLSWIPLTNAGFLHAGEGDGTTPTGDGNVVTGEVPLPDKSEEPPQVYHLEVDFFDVNGGMMSPEYSADFQAGEVFNVPVPVFDGYSVSTTQEGVTLENNVLTGTMTGPMSILVTYTPANTGYTVVHMLESLDGTTYVEDKRFDFPGNVGEMTQAEPQNYPGFTAQAFDQEEITAAGTEVEILYTRNTQKLSYDSRGGSYVDPQYGKYGQTVAITDVMPTYYGYTFQGWCTDAGLTTKAEGNVTLNGDVTLYAKWDAGNADYKVVWWQQKVSDDKNATNAEKTYDYLDSESYNVKAGTNVSAQSYSREKLAMGFKFNAEKSVDVVVNADGTTVLNVYYDRELCTIHYMEKEGWNWKETNKVTGLYGAPLGPDDWDTSKFWYEMQYSHGGSQLGSQRILLTSFDFVTAGYAEPEDFRNVYFYAGDIDKTYSISYYQEQLDGSFKRVQTVYTSQSGLTMYEKYTGYTLYKYYASNEALPETTDAAFWSNKKDATNGASADVSYKSGSRKYEYTKIFVASKLQSYTLDFYSGTQKVDSKTVRYTEPLAGYGSLTLTADQKPANLQGDYYSFGGWAASDAADAQAFDFNSTMPSHNVAVYAIWTVPQMTVNVKTVDGGTEKELGTVEVTAGQKLDRSQLTQYEAKEGGYIFQGWFRDAACTEPFAFDKPIETDGITVYAKWAIKTTATYIIRYLNAETGEPVFPDTAPISRSLDGQQFTVNAKLHPELVPDAMTKSYTLKADDSQNVIIFEYSKPAAIEYTVRYLNIVTNEPVAPEKKESTTSSQVIVDYIPLDGFYPTSRRQTLTLATAGTNLVTFYYRPIVEVQVTGEVQTAVYNGLPQEAKGVSITGINDSNIVVKLKEGAGVATRTNVGDAYMGLNYNSFDIICDENLYKVNINVVSDGKLTITPRPVTLTSGTLSKVYDGSALEASVTGEDGTLIVTDSGSIIIPEGQNLTDVLTLTAGKNSITYPGTSKEGNIFTYAFKDQNMAANYTVTTVFGNLMITAPTVKVQVDVTAKSDSKVYDGEPLTVSGLLDTIKVDGAPVQATIADNGDITFSANLFGANRTYTIKGLSASATGTDVDDSGNVIVTGEHEVYEVTKNGEVDVTDLFSIVRNSGRLDITKRPVTLTSASDSKPYDGSPLTNSNVSVGGSGWVKDQGADYNVTGSVLLPSDNSEGKPNNNFTYTLHNGTKAENYEISLEYGVLTITNRTDEQKHTVQVQAVDLEAPYNAQNQTVTGEGVKVDGILGTTFTWNGHTYKIAGLSTSGTGLHVKAQYATNVVGNGVITDANGNDVTAQFKIEKLPGVLTITPLEIILITESAEKSYDGTALQNLTWSYGNDNRFLENDTTVTVTGSQTIAGSSDNTIKVEYGTKWWQELLGMTQNENPNYNVTTRLGTLTVTPPFGEGQYEIDLFANTVNKKYDGIETEVVGFTVKHGDKVLAGSAGNENVTFTLKNEKGVDVTFTLKAKASSGSHKNVGSYDVVFDNKVEIKQGLTDASGWFVVNTHVGKLNIEKRLVTLTSASATKNYDGTPLYNHTVTVSGDDFADGETIKEYNVTGKQTVVGSSKNTFSYTITNDGNWFNSLGKEVLASNYIITKVEGDLTVTDRNAMDLALVANSDSKTYDGTALDVKGYKLYLGKDATGQLLREVPENGNGTFEITVGEGANAKQVTYTINASASGTATHVNDEGKVAIATTIQITDAEGNDVTTQFTVWKTEGKATITPRPVTLTSATDTKVYDGTPLTNHEVNITAGSFANDADEAAILAAVNVTGSRTLPGGNEGNNNIAIDKSKFPDYNITLVPGTLTVTELGDDKYVISLTGVSGEVDQYDGQSHSLTGYTAKVQGESVGETHTGTGISFTVTNKNGQKIGYTLEGVILTGATGVNAGTYPVTVEMDPAKTVVKDQDGNDVTSQFVISTVNGGLTIGKRAVTLTSDGGSKAFDGTPLTNGNVKITAGSFVQGEGVEAYNVTGSQTLPGESANTFEISKYLDGTNPDNYRITKINGNLKVTDGTVAIHLTANSAEHVYDGAEHTAKGFSTMKLNGKETAVSYNQVTKSISITIGQNEYTLRIAEPSVSGTDVTMDNAASPDGVGYYISRIPGTWTVLDANGTNVTQWFNVTGTDGKLTITKQNVTLSSKDKSQLYVGTPLVTQLADITAIGFVGEEGAEFTPTGSQTLVGSSLSSFTYKLKADTKAINYKITYKPGTLTVTDESGGKTVDPDKVITKTHDDKAYGLGDTVTFTIDVINIYDEIKNITVTDNLNGVKIIGASDNGVIAADGKSVQFTGVAGGAKVSVTATYTVTEADILAGKITNTATADFTDKTYTNEDEVKPEDKKGELTLVKEITSTDATGDGKYDLGEVIEYKITATNTGNLTLTNVVVTDDLTGDRWTVATLAPGASQSFDADYTVKEADLLAGTVMNVVTATADSPDPENPDPTVIPDEIPAETEDPLVKLDMVKTVKEPTRVYKLGDTVTYTITVKNSGNQTVKNILVNDPLGNLADYQITELKPGESHDVSATITHVVTENDIIDAQDGKLTNVATAKGDGTPDFEGTADAILAKAEPAIAVTKTASITANAAEGTVIPYQIAVTNNGNVTLNNVQLTDVFGHLPGESKVFSIGTLAPGASTVVNELTYTVTQADMIRGSVVNTAIASGDPANGAAAVEAKDSTITTTVKAVGSLAVDKQIDGAPANGTAYVLGEKISYKITVTNTGNLTLTNVLVLDGLTGLRETVATLAPGASRSFITVHTVTEADLAAQTVLNKATAEANSPDETKPTGEDEVTVTPEQLDDVNGHLTVVKEVTSSPANGAAYGLNETVAYRITVTNDGNMTLSDVQVVDDLTGDVWNVGTMAPGAVQTFTTGYLVTDADLLQAGTIKNVATATGTVQQTGDPAVVTPDDAEAVDQEAGPSLVLTKEVNNPDPLAATMAPVEVGDSVTYTVTITNNGNVTLQNILVEDAMTGNRWTIATLAPNASVQRITDAYLVTEADVIRGYIQNVLTGSAEKTDGDPIDVPDAVETVDTEEAEGKLELVKEITSTDADNDGEYALGEVINYRITATNTGNLTLTNVVITDDLTGDSWTVAAFAPGAVQIFNADYTVTEADLLAGTVVNVVTATGDSPDPDQPDPGVIPGEVPAETEEAEGKLSLTKNATSTPANGVAFAAGEVVSYQIVATNTGNLTLTDVIVTDDLTGDSWSIPTLAPGASQTFTTAPYTVTETDVLAGSVLNVATATADSPDPNDPTPIVPPADEEVPVITPNPSMFLNKEILDAPATVVAGAEITYQITVINNGNVTLTDVEIADALTGDSWKLASLAPAAQQVYTVTYTVTEADLVAGTVVNNATVTATDPEGNDVTTQDSETLETEEAVSSLILDKTVTSAPANGESYEAGETVTYRITASNTGNLTLTDVTVVDALTGDEWTVDTMAPGAVETFDVTYLVTEADAAAGTVVNTVTATVGSTPGAPGAEPNDGPDVTPDDVAVPIKSEYQLTIHYVYEDGTPAAPDFVSMFQAGALYGPIFSPDLDGYAADIAFVRSGANGMPTQDVELTVTYTALPEPEPIPEPPATEPPATEPEPTEPAPTEPDPIPEPTPGVEVDEDDEGNLVITPVIDPQVPLAPPEEGHICCILHFLLVLAALITLGFYTKSMKKHQARIAELKEMVEANATAPEAGEAEAATDENSTNE